MNAAENTRKTPRQKRSQLSIDCVLEAAAQVLESIGEAGFNTNAVADRAGVSIGTLYRYFPDKKSILIALALRERDTFKQTVIAAFQDGEPRMAPDRRMIRAFLRAFAGRARARRVAVAMLLANADHQELAADFAFPAEGVIDAHGRTLNRIQMFVLSRAVHGAMRAAVLEGADFLLSEEFENELVRLSRSYLGFPAGRGAASQLKLPQNR